MNRATVLCLVAFYRFFLLFLMVTDFDVVFSVVRSQISHKAETIFLSKTV